MLDSVLRTEDSPASIFPLFQEENRKDREWCEVCGVEEVVPSHRELKDIPISSSLGLISCLLWKQSSPFLPYCKRL